MAIRLKKKTLVVRPTKNEVENKNRYQNDDGHKNKNVYCNIFVQNTRKKRQAARTLQINKKFNDLSSRKLDKQGTKIEYFCDVYKN